MEYTKPSGTCSKNRSAPPERFDPDRAEQLPLFGADADAALDEVETEGEDWRTDHARQTENPNLLRGNRQPRPRLPDREAQPHTSEQRQADEVLKPHQVGVRLDAWIDAAVAGGLPKSAAKVVRFLREAAMRDPGKPNYLRSWHSQEVMSSELGMSARTLRWALRELRRVGMIQVWQPRTADGEYRRVRYTLCPGQLSPEAILPASTGGNSSETGGNSSEVREAILPGFLPPKVTYRSKKTYRTGENAGQATNSTPAERRLEKTAYRIRGMLQPLQMDAQVKRKAGTIEYAYEVDTFLRIWTDRGHSLDELAGMLPGRIRDIEDQGKTLTGVRNRLDAVMRDHHIYGNDVEAAVADRPHEIRVVVDDYLRGKDWATKLGKPIRELMIRTWKEYQS